MAKLEMVGIRRSHWRVFGGRHAHFTGWSLECHQPPFRLGPQRKKRANALDESIDGHPWPRVVIPGFPLGN